ncbi:hypothetical protein AK812_SmicGene15640 [Symbiodinium microadriaticum]|uniref:Uncharacterized protein n=1 Tax=Symbiodinium microadriaticum TaxID=2951 RepID=A0A1Q9E2E1_SYMMI|nr:hypothetical protein AK812_SmicGene15640 [Symbiodinium microadriaticum]
MMSIFGVPMSTPLKPSSLMDTGIAKATAKFYANKEVFLARAPLKAKLKLCQAVVTGSALWYSCAVPPTAQAMGALNTTQLELVSKMAGFRRGSDETWCEFRLRSLRGARQILCNNQDSPPKTVNLHDIPEKCQAYVECLSLLCKKSTLEQAYAWVFLGAHLTEAFEDSWQDGELAPDWFWDLLDMGGDLCRAGVKAADLAILLTEFASTRRDTLPDYFWQTEPIRNRLMRAWEVVCAHYFTCDLPLPPGLNDRQFSRMAEESIRHQWHRARIEGRDLFKAREPPPEARRDTDVDPPGRALPEGSCRQHPDFDADAPPRSTSPPPGLGQHERSRSPKRRHRMATSSTYRTQSDQAAQGPDSSRYTDAPDPDEDPDFTALVADRWLLKPQKTHLKRSSPRRITTETVILRAPWKKGGNPPLQTRPSGPVHPTFPPPPTSTKPRVTCPIDLEEADDETEEVAVEINATANDEAIAVWQALFEFEPREALEPSAVPVIPQSNLDNMVETLLDKPEPEYQQMVRSATSFLARMATDVHSAIERAKALRDRLRNKPSSSKGPEAEEGSLMQTTIENVLASPKAAILALLRDAFLALTPGACVARAQQLLAKLKDHEGPLAVDRQTLQAALIVYSQGNPETATGDRYICQFAWVAHWWAVLEGRKLPGPASSDIDFLDRALPESGESDVDPALAEQLQFEEEEKAYQQGLEEAVAHHERMAKANPGSPAAETGPGPTSPTRRDQGSTNRSAFQWHPPTKRLCLGICFADGRQQKAWDWELNVGDQVDLHVRAQYRDRPGYWTREGRPVPYEQLPPSLQAEYGPSTSSSSSDRLPPAAPHFSMNLDRPATRALYDRWQRGIIGDHAVRDVGGDTFLQFFRACSNIGEDTLAEVECLDTMPGPPAEGRDPSDVTQLDEPGEHTGPTSTTSTSRPVLTSHGGLDDQAHPDPYYNGELYWERYGRQDESEQDSESSWYIMEYLRCGTVEVPWTMPKGILKQLEREADFFALPGLVHHVRARLVEKHVKVSIFVGRFMCSNDGCNCGAGQKVEINEVEGLSFFDTEFIHPRAAKEPGEQHQLRLSERRPTISAPSCVLQVVLQLQPVEEPQNEAEGREGTGPVALELTEGCQEQATAAIRHALVCCDEICPSSADEIASDDSSPVRRALTDLALNSELTFLQWLARADEYKVGDPNDARFQFVHYEKCVTLTFEVLQRPETSFGTTSPWQNEDDGEGGDGDADGDVGGDCDDDGDDDVDAAVDVKEEEEEEEDMGMLAVCRKVWATEGIRGFFRGVVPPLMGSSVSASVEDSPGSVSGSFAQAMIEMRVTDIAVGILFICG